MGKKLTTITYRAELKSWRHDPVGGTFSGVIEGDKIHQDGTVVTKTFKSRADYETYVIFKSETGDAYMCKKDQEYTP